jgi:hypothetical protein
MLTDFISIWVIASRKLRTCLRRLLTKIPLLQDQELPLGTKSGETFGSLTEWAIHTFL